MAHVGKRPTTENQVHSVNKCQRHELDTSFDGGKENVANFLEFIKSLKAMLIECPQLGAEETEALMKRILTLLPPIRFQHLALEQVCSRHIEFVLKQTLIHLDEALSEVDQDPTDTSVRKINAIVTAWLRMGSNLLDGVAVDLAHNQYASHTVDVVIRGVTQILLKKKHVSEVFQTPIVERFETLIKTLSREILIQPREVLLKCLTHIRATFIFRTISETILACSGQNTELVELFTQFFDHLLDDNVNIMRNQLFLDQAASPTLQVLMHTYIAIVNNGDKFTALRYKTLGPEIDFEWFDKMVIESPIGNRMVEFLLVNVADETYRHRFIDDYLMVGSPKTRFDTFLMHTSSPAKYILKAVLINTVLTERQIRRLCKLCDLNLIFGHHTSLTRGIIQSVSKCSKKEVRRVLNILRATLNCDDQENSVVPDNCNFWSKLATLNSKDPSTLSFEGLCIAADIVTHISSKKMGRFLVAQLAESIAQGILNPKLAGLTKKGVALLQAALKSGTTEYIVAIRLGVLQNVRLLVFNAYGSYLVSDIYPFFNKKEKKHFLALIKPLSSDLLKINFALYQQLKLDKLLNQAVRSDDVFQRFKN